jgi:hypothetical protein
MQFLLLKVGEKVTALPSKWGSISDCITMIHGYTEGAGDLFRYWIGWVEIWGVLLVGFGSDLEG